jgi:NAD(P)H-flavin reductase
MRTIAPFGRRLARIAGVERVGGYALVWAEDADGPPDPRPGQFYMLAAEQRWGGGADERPWLPRAFSFCRAEEGRLGFVLEDIGPGTHRLAGLSEGDGLWLTGPLGTGFTAPDEGRALLVGGGIGVAPILCWSDELGPAARVLLGFRSREYAEAAGLFRGAVELATDDGSAGRRAYVTELLREELDRDAAATVYACGPPPMLEAVRALCGERGVRAQLAMESGMACGFGACFGCVVPTRTGYVRLCVDGPVLDAAELATALAPGTGH